MKTPAPPMGEQNNGFYSASPLQNDSNGPVMMTLLCVIHVSLSLSFCVNGRGKKSNMGRALSLLTVEKACLQELVGEEGEFIYSFSESD